MYNLLKCVINVIFLNRLVLKELEMFLFFEGVDGNCIFIYNVQFLEENKYLIVG